MNLVSPGAAQSDTPLRECMARMGMRRKCSAQGGSQLGWNVKATKMRNAGRSEGFCKTNGKRTRGPQPSWVHQNGERFSENFTLTRRSARSHIFKSDASPKQCLVFSDSVVLAAAKILRGIPESVLSLLDPLLARPLQDSSAGKWRGDPLSPLLYALFESLRRVGRSHLDHGKEPNHPISEEPSFLIAPALSNAWSEGGDPSLRLGPSRYLFTPSSLFLPQFTTTLDSVKLGLMILVGHLSLSGRV